jgi:hypothetical protein
VKMGAGGSGSRFHPVTSFGTRDFEASNTAIKVFVM